ncbi:MAG: hypothetical protein IK999_01855 [Ruminococcus sp.]|nr:hypothetical protein [Ruminococcus sp.]
MDKKKLLAALMAAAVLGLSGCGDKTGDTADESAAQTVTETQETETSAAETSAPEETTTTTTTTTAPPESEAETITTLEKYIGESDALNAQYTFALTNSTGSVITSFEVKYGDGEYGEDLLPYSENFDVDESRQFSFTNNISGEVLTIADYSVRLTYEDGSEQTLHVFPMSEIVSAEIRSMDGFPFLVYIDKFEEEENTMETERTRFEEDEKKARDSSSMILPEETYNKTDSSSSDSSSSDSSSQASW